MEVRHVSRVPLDAAEKATFAACRKLIFPISALKKIQILG
jgi:hypothetical protein